MLSGDNGILQKATVAKENTDDAQIKERIQLAELSARTDGKGDLIYSKLNEELTKEFGAKGTGYNISDESENPWKITVGDVEYDISHAVAPTIQPGESGYAGSSYNDPYIPIGFTHTGTEDWNHGYTITGNADGTNPGDQFVWVPCSTEETPPDGVVKFTKITTGKYSWPHFNLHPSGGINANVNAEDSTVAEIRTSVGEYGGFYIAKYEAGIVGNNANYDLFMRTSQGTATDGSVKPLSQAGVGVWNYITRANCLTVSKAMIPLATTGVKSTLISGECWDTTLAWITATADSSYPENSVDKGWYSGNYGDYITTGYYGTNTNNIFDMGGNVSEYTSENCFLNDPEGAYQGIICRGGSSQDSGSEYPASSRLTGWDDESANTGFRVILYK